MNNLFLKWLQENVQRLFTKSPKFFVWWQRIAGALLILTTVPEFLQMFDVELGPPFNTYLSKGVMIASATILWMARLSSQSTPVAITKDGEVLKKTDSEKLPFTDIQEKKIAVEEGGILNPETEIKKEVVNTISPLPK